MSEDDRPVNPANQFSNLEEAWLGFKRNGLSEFTPPKIQRAIEGGFYSGAQAMFVLLTEALDLDPTTCTPEVGRLFAQCQTFFEIQRARVASEQLEKENGKKRRS